MDFTILHFAIHIVWRANVICTYRKSGIARKTTVAYPELRLIRFIIQKKMADIHPLITIFGVVIGLSLFGFMGVIFGPLLLSLFFLFVDMFKKGYLDGEK